MKNSGQRFNLAAIEAGLRSVQAVFGDINDRVDNRREAMTDTVVDNILAAYRHLNGLLEKRVDLFAKEGLAEIMELNHIVLCGADPDQRSAYRRHVEATRDRFRAGIKAISRWYRDRDRKANPFKIAAGVYVRVLSRPQLFLEGNHRTGNLIVNQILLARGKAPFVLDADNALAYFNPSTRIKDARKGHLVDDWIMVPGYAKAFRRLLENYGDEKYLRELSASAND